MVVMSVNPQLSGRLQQRIRLIPDVKLSFYLYTQYCTFTPFDGPFSLISMTSTNGIIKRINFTMRSSNRYTVGDIALIWGRPEIRNSPYAIVYYWPSTGVGAAGEKGGISSNYFTSLERVWMRLED
jgi:hypothetical protein